MNDSEKGGIGLLGVMFVVLLALILLAVVGVLPWSAPLIWGALSACCCLIPLLIVLAALFVAGAFGVLAALSERW